VRTLAGIASLGLDVALRAAILAASTPEEVMDVIYQVDEVHGSEDI